MGIGFDDATKFVGFALMNLVDQGHEELRKNLIMFKSWDNKRRARWIAHLQRHPHLPLARLVLARASLLRIKG